MINETKRDVFDETVKRLYDAANYEGLDIDAEFRRKGTTVEWELQTRYDTALPDDLPVIPKDVSEWLTWCKRSNHSLKDALDGETRVSEDTFARAWLDGAWLVEETGEIVKMEAEK